MTPGELSTALNAMTPEEYGRFIARYGGGTPYNDRESVVAAYAHKREHEGRLCYLLGLPTEEDKRVAAAIESATAARQSAGAAAESAGAAKASAATARLALWVAIAAVVVSIVNLVLSMR